MRNNIHHLRSLDLPWQWLSAGVYRKLLNCNEQTGEITALFKFVPEEGAMPPSQPHYHSVYEELFIIEGKMTFNHTTWLSENGYVFHPPNVVHGTNSAIPETTVFIGRMPAGLDFNYLDPVPASSLNTPRVSPASGNQATYLNPPAEENWEVLNNAFGDEIGRRLPLNIYSQAGKGAQLLRLNAGSKVAANPKGYSLCNEGFILSGSVIAGDGTEWRTGDYWHRHPNTPVAALSILKDTLIFNTIGDYNDAA